MKIEADRRPFMTHSDQVMAQLTEDYINNGADRWHNGDVVVMPRLTCAWLVVRDTPSGYPLRLLELWLASPHAESGKLVMTFVYRRRDWRLVRIF